MNPVSRIFKWLVGNIGLGLALYFGLVQGIDGAANIAQFYIWFVFVISWYALDDNLLRNSRKQGPSPIPPWISQMVFLSFMALLIWYAWFWSAGAYLIAFLLLNRQVSPPPTTAAP